jgi:hypothetical protein
VPQGSRFCPKCGESAGPTLVTESGPIHPDEIRALFAPRRKHRHAALWFLLPVLALTIVYAALSDTPGAQQLRRFFDPSHIETAAPDAFTVKAKAYSYYRIDVPAGASRVTVNGTFNVVGAGDGVEVSVLSDAGFAAWQEGYGSNSYYSSGRVSEGNVSADLPGGPGVYVLVFDNRFSPRTPKSVQTALTLHYRRWWTLF